MACGEERLLLSNTLGTGMDAAAAAQLYLAMALENFLQSEVFQKRQEKSERKFILSFHLCCEVTEKFERHWMMLKEMSKHGGGHLPPPSHAPDELASGQSNSAYDKPARSDWYLQGQKNLRYLFFRESVSFASSSQPHS